MKKVRVCLAILIMLFVTFAFTVSVKANDSLILNVDKNEVNLGEDILVSINLDSEYTDLYAYTAKLSYDRDVFEVIETEDFEEQENWTDIQYNKDNNKFALINKKGINGKELLQVKLKVREDAKAGKTAVTVNSVTASDGKKDIEIEGSSAEVLVLKDSLNEGESISDNKVQIPEEDNSVIKTKRDLPVIGILLIILMLIIVIAVIYYYLKIAKKDSNNKNGIVAVIALILLIILLALTIKTFNTKDVDVNNDGEVSYDDAKDITEYILEIEREQDDNAKEEEDVSDKDVNNDGKITISDVAQTVSSASNQQYTGSITAGTSGTSGTTVISGKEKDDGNHSTAKPNKIKYETSVENSVISNFTPKKGEEITLDLNIDITPYTDVKSVIIDGKEYSVEKIKGNNYKVTIPAPKQSGSQDVVITGVVLDNGKVVETEYKVTLDILKDLPKIDKFSIDTEKEIPELVINVSDKDGAIKSGKVVITDEEGNVVFKSNKLANGQNKYVLDGLKKEKKYNVKVEVEYDLDSNVYGKPEDNSGKKKLLNRDFVVNAKYGFTGKDYKITDKVTDKEAVIVSFKNSYNSDYDVEYVVIDGQKYPVSKIGDTYQLILEKGSKGQNKVVIEEVVLKNGASYNVNKELSYVYLKNEPVIGEVQAELNDSKVKVKVESEDVDGAIKNVTVYLIDEEGNVVDTKVLENGQTEAEFEINKSGKYKARVEVVYDLGDGSEVKKEVEYKDEIKEPVKVTIVSNSMDSKYVQKGQKVELTYKVETNTNDVIESFVVNGVTLPATKNADGTYTVSFNALQTTGEAELEITKVVFEKEGEIETNYVSYYEVLKSTKPVVDGISIVEKEGDKATLAFTIKDEEDTFVSGKIVITDKKSKDEKTIVFTDVNDTVKEIDAIDFRKYNVDIYITYDLDKDKENKDNQYEELFANKEFELLGDFEFNFNNLKVKNVDRDKNVVELQFNATLAEKAEDYYVEKVMINGISYNASRNGTTYIVEIPITNYERQELTVQEVILNNAQGFAVNENNNVVVFKTTPTAIVRSTVTRELVDGLRTITASLQVMDEDATIVSGTLHARLLNAKGNQIDTLDLSVSSEEVVFNSKDIYDAGTYTIEVCADYNTVDGIDHKAEKLGDAKVGVPIYANIDKAEINKKYVQKGEELEIKYTISTNTEEDITGITINGDVLPVAKNSDGTYTVVISAPDKYGKLSFEATRLVYENEQAAVTNIVETDVLRSVKPSISDVIVNDDNPDTPVLSFDIKDEEDTFVSGKAIITGNGKKQEIEIESVNNTTFELENIEKNQEYAVEIEITYDMDSDKEIDSEHQDSITESCNFEIIGEYNFKLDEFRLVKVDTDNKVIVLAFDSENSSKYDVEKAYVNGNEYTVKSKDNTTYTIEVPYEDETRTELTLDKVTLGNLKGFTNLGQNSIIVFKNAPTTNINVTLSDEMNSIKAEFDVLDTDDVLSAVYVRLLDAEGNTVETKTVEEHIKEVEFTAEGDSFKAGEYTVEILADFNRDDGKSHIEEVIAQDKAKVKILATVENASAEKYYVDKESIIKITYDIKSNTDEILQFVTINGEVLTPRKITDGKYEVIVNTPDIAGEYVYKLTDLVYSEDETISVTNETKVDVLKNTRPEVSAVSIDTTLDKPKLSFMISDDEDTFIKGRIVVTSIEDKSSYEIPFESLDTLEFELNDIEKFEKYELEIYVTYDFDSNQEGTENQQEELFVEKEFEVIGDYNFTLDNFRIKEVNTQEEVIVLQFESTNASEDNDEFEDYYVDTVVINGTSYENVVKTGTTYTVEVPYTKIERTELVLEKAILNNLQEFTITEKNKLVAFKSLSAIVIGTVSNDLKSITADVKLTDEDEIATDVHIRLLDSNGKELDDKLIESKGEIVTFENHNEYYTAGDYTIEVVASYDAVDGLSHKDEVIVTTKVEVATGAMIVKSNSEKYAQKGEALPVEYNILTNTDAEVDEIVVNQEVYKAQKVSNGIYRVNVVVPEEAGEKDLTVTKINFKNDKSANVNYTSKVEVLKSVIPTVSNLTISGNKYNPVLSFNISDEENTFISGKYVIINQETKERKEYTFNAKDNTSFLLKDIQEFNKYEAEVYITYDLDSDTSVGSENQKEILAQKGQFEIIGEYNFTLENFRIIEVNRDTKKVKLAFESTNASEDNDEYTDYYVNQVEINGKTYGNIKKDGKTYTLEIPYEKEERTELYLTKAVLDNLKEFTDLQNSVVIFKNKPSVELNTYIDDKQENIKADIVLTNEDNTLKDLNVRLINPKGDVIETRDIDNDEVSVSFKSPENGMFKAGEYKIEVGADYEIDDGLEHKSKETIGEAIVKVATVATVTESKVENYYVEKGENVNIIYTFKSNNDNAPTGVMVDNALYGITKNDDGLCTAAILADSTSYGAKECTVSVVMYDGETVILNEPVKNSYYVLKSAPNIQDYTFNKLTKNPNITFNFKNDDEALLNNASIVIVDEEGNEVITQDIVKDLNTVDLQSLSNGKYTVKVKGTYDLDDEIEDDLNTYNLSDIFKEQEIDVIANYETKLNVEKVKVDSAEREIVLTFESTNAAGYETKYIIIDGKEYEVSVEGGKYVARIPYEDATKREYSITGVKVENDIELDLEETQSFKVFKETPSVEVTPQVSEDSMGISAEFTLKDTDNTVTALYAKLLGKDGKIVKEVNLDRTAESVEFKSDELYEAGEYTVEIYADYDLVDGNDYNKKTIGSKTVVVDVQAKIVSSTVNTKYAQKNTDIKVEYEIASNTDKELTGIVVNNDKTLSVNKLEKGNYEVTYTVKDSFGEEEINAQKLIYPEKEIEVNNTATVYVLKDAPSITEYVFSDEYQKANASFKFTDSDDAVIDKAKVVVTKVGTSGTVLEQDVVKDINTVKLEDLDNSKYELKIVGQYDLDEDNGNSTNEHNIEEIFEPKEIKFISDYKLTFNISKVEVVKDESKVKVIFESTNEGNYPVSFVIIDGTRYPVVNEKGVSYALVDYTEEVNQKKTISNVVLANGVELAVENNSEFEIFKNAPSINDLTTQVDGDSITANFQVVDDAGIMANAKVLLINANGETVQKVEIDKDFSTVTFDNIEKAGKYTIRIVADYDRVDGETHKEEILSETTANTQIVATIKDDVTPTYAEKNEEIEVIYEIESNTVDKVKRIEVNGSKCDVTETEDGKYKVKYITGTTAGDEAIKVTSIEYDGEDVQVEYSSSVEILKDELTVNNFNVDTSGSQVKVNYDMTDEDNSFVSGRIIAKNIAKKEVIELPISADSKEYNLELKESEIYDVELEISYDRDNDNKNSKHQDTKIYGKQEDVQFVTNYDLEISEFKLNKVERDTLFNANIKFKATNSSIYQIHSVIIDGFEYQVKLVDDEEDTYLLEYPYGKEKLDVKKEITVTDVVLTNNATVELENKQSVVIFKDKPYAQSVKLENKDNSNIKVNFELIDNDDTVSTIYVVLQNENGDSIAEQTLDSDKSEAEFVVSQSGKYNAVIKADYDSVDGLTHSKEVIATSEETTEIMPKALVTTQDITEVYPKKNEAIEITYKIETNTMVEPTKLVLNDREEYELTLVNKEENKYKISYTASDTSQIENLQVTKVYFGDNLPVNISNAAIDVIEVLKSEPTVTIESTDILEQNAVMFVINVNDPDEAMTSGIAKVHEQTKTLTRGQNNFLVSNINPDEDHILSVDVQYDLDYNTIEKDKNNSSVNKEQEFRLVSDYGFKINDIKAFNKDGKEQKYFAKNEKMQLRFNCENKTSLVPEKVTIQDLRSSDSNSLEYTVNTVEADEMEKSGYKYYVDIVTNAKAGEQEFKINSVTLNGSRILPAEKFLGENPTVIIEVEKDIPTISDFTANNQEDNLTVEFNIKDDDKALKDSYIVLTSGGKEVAKSDLIKAGNNKYTFNKLTPGQKYTIKVQNNYKLRNDDVVHNEVFKEQEIEITRRSDFRVKNLTITKRVPINSEVGITFENSLMSYNDVDKIVIQEIIDNKEQQAKEYEVSKGDDGVYKLTLQPRDKGINKIHIVSVKIGDKDFEIDRNLSYTYEYEVPVAKEVTEISEDISTNEAVINYQLEDNDNAVVGLTAYMKNSAGSIIATKKIELDDEVTKTVKMDLRKVSTYTIELRATCDIGDNATFEEKTLFEKKKETVPRVTILEQSIDQEYVERNENVELTFKINTNVDQGVKKISIGDESYKVTKVTEDNKIVEDTYSITVQAPSETGVFSQEIVGIQIGSNLVNQIVYPEGTEPINIKVYKQKPTISHFIIDENNNKVSFKVNDSDKSLVTPYPNFIVKEKDATLHTEELQNGEAEYEFDLDAVGMTEIQNEYNVAVDVTYDLRPDVQEKQEEKQSIFKKITNLIANDEEASEEETPPEEDPNAKYIVKENIFNESYKLSGKIEYNLNFKGSSGLYSLGEYQSFFFNCSTGTQYKVSKVIIDGREYPVKVNKARDDGVTFYYEGAYKAFSYDQEYITYEKVILENGAALDIPYSDGHIWCMIVQTDPTFVIKDFVENIDEETVTFSYKLTDKDKKLYTNLTFTLMNSQGGVIGEPIEVDPDEDKIFEETGILASTVSFKVPYPPTAVYRLQVSGGLIEMPGYYDYLRPWTPVNDEYQSSITTSILSSKLETRYPKKGDTIAIDYVISSTKVILIDKEDHLNQNKAVNITSLVINGRDYDVQMLEDVKDTYRIFYPVQNEDGLENIDVTQIKFSNGEVADFNHSDTIEVLKSVPYVADFKTENDLVNKKVKLSFVVNDPDGAIGINDIKAKIGNEEKQINVGENNAVEFEVTPDELVDFEVKASYDLDNNRLLDETDANSNTYTDYVIFTKKLMLTGDYKVEFSNMKEYNAKSEETTYFEKNEDIRLVFDCTTRAPELYPEKIKIAGEEYELTKVPETENSYETIISGSDKAQKVNAKIDDITLNSGNVVPIENQNVEYEILKDHTKISDISYDVSNSNADKVDLKIKFEDPDGANKITKVKIIDEYGYKADTTLDNLSNGVNDVLFKKTGAEKYTVTIYSTYDRDSDNTDEVNYYNDVKIHSQVVSLTTRYIEMKDIVDIKLYTFDDLGNAVKVDSLTEENLNVVENSLVEVSMKNIPTFYSNVESYRVEDNKLKLVLSYTDAMVYTGEEELKPLEVTLDILEDTQEYEYKGSFKSLVEMMRAHNTKGDVINLDKDYDLSDYQLKDKQTAYIDFDYKGTINANGHTISNLTKPLFNKLDGATIENLNIKGIVFSGGDAKGVVATYSTNETKISNVHVENLVSPDSGTSALVYELSNSSVIEKCSATNLTFNTGYLCQSLSAGVVNMKNNSKIENCYVQGTIASGWWHNAGIVVDTDDTCEISHNIVNMKMTAYFGLGDKAYGHGCGGIVCSDFNNGKPDTKGLNLKNNLSLVIGNAGVGAIYNPKRATLSSQSQNNYQLDTAVTKNEEKNGVITISEDDINKDFFINQLGLDTEIWNVSDDSTMDKLPTLKGVSNSYMDEGKRPENTEIYIPDYKRVSELDSYKEDREITYHNMYKLMPFYDAKEIIRDGNKIPDGHNLTKKIVQYIVPFNKEGNMISNLTTENYKSLDKIYIVYEDGTKDSYEIAFDDYYGNVVSYMITELNVGYNYNKYVVDTQQDSVRRLINLASSYEFKEDLAPVTASIEEDSRLYKEHFDKYTKKHIDDFVINLLVDLGYSPNFESEVLDDIIESSIIKSGKLKEYLFAYNYFTYWYNLDMDGINLADSVMFHSSEMFDKDMTMKYLTSQLIQGSNSATNGTAGFYNNYFVKYTRISNLGLFLDYYVNTLTHYKCGDDWFKANWQGGIYRSVNVEGTDELDYTLWDHLKKDGKVQTDFLPLMTVPENSTYVMSSPSQAYFGSLRVYMTDPNDSKQMEAFEKKVNVWLKEVQSFYTFAYNYWGPNNINKYCDTNYDMRFTLTGKGNATVYNNPLTTEEPYHKYFLEAVGRWAASHGGAYANGNEVFWAAIKMLDNFRVGTHETLHNQDSKIFLNGYGRRGNAEDYAAGFIQQYYRDGWVSPNIFDEEEDLENPVFKDNTTQNLRKSSVEDNEKLKAYYNKYFRVNDFLDWIEAKAYFQLSDEQKANISVQVSYPKVKDQEAGDEVVAYTPLTKDMVEKMNLNDMQSLWDNKIMLRPGVSKYEERSPGADTDSIFNIHWYQPHSDNSRPDGANFKYIAWQMAGEGGYYEGLVPYYSLSYIGIKENTGVQTTDLIALRYIMKDESITFEKYKLGRYEELAKHYNDQGTYINAEQIYQEYVEALKTDAENKDRKLTQSTKVKKKYFQKIRLETNDFNIEPFEQKAEAAGTDETDEVATIDSRDNKVEIDSKRGVTSMPKEKEVTIQEENVTASEEVMGNSTVTNEVYTESNEITTNTNVDELELPKRKDSELDDTEK